MSLREVLQMNCSAGRRGPSYLGSPQQDQAVRGKPGWPFWRDEKGFGVTPRSSPSRSTITFIASGTHASAIVSGSESLTNLCVPASTARGSRTSEHDAAVSGKSLETCVGILLMGKLVARSSFHDELCVVVAGGWGAQITQAMFLCCCVTGDSTVQTKSLFLTACRRGGGRNKAF